MRVCKADLLYALTRTPLSTATVLHLPTQKIEHLTSGLLECVSLLCLRLDDNNLEEVTAAELGGCSGLYEVGLRGNILKRLDGLKEFQVFGQLDLSGNALSLDALEGMEHVHVFEFSLRGNKDISGSGERSSLNDEMLYRVKVLEKVPRAWTLDGHFVSARERVSSGASKLPALQANQVGKFPPLGSPAYTFMTTIAPNAPTKNQDAVDEFRLELLLAHYDGSSARHNKASREQVHKPKLAPRPVSHISTLCALGYRERLDLAVLLCARVQYDVPISVLQGAMSVMLSSQVSGEVIRDISNLPPFACTSVIRLLRGLAIEEVDPGSGDKRLVAQGNLYSRSDKELLMCIPKIVVKHRVERGEKEKYDGGEGFLCRHAVLLLQRSPYCPMVTATKQATAEMERLYEAMEPLFDAAGFGRDDLSLGREGDVEFKPNKMQPSRPYRRFWSENSSLQSDPSVTSAAGMDNIMPPHTPISPMANMNFIDEFNSIKLEYSSLDGKVWRNLEGQDGGHCNVTVGKFFSRPIKEKATEGRKPRDGEPVRIFPNLYTPILRVGENGSFVVVKDWNGPDDVYVEYRTGQSREIIFERDHLAWDPRGFWSHFEVFRMLALEQASSKTSTVVARKTSGLHRSGFSRGGVSVAVPQALVKEVKESSGDAGGVENGGNKLQVFSADSGWDSSFVVAPPALIAAQNYFTGADGDVWSKIEAAPATLVDTTVGSVVVVKEDIGENDTGGPGTRGKMLPGDTYAPATIVDGGHSIMDSSIGSSSVRSRFGVGREQLYEEFSDLMKEMGSYRNIELGKVKAASMNPLGAVKGRKGIVDVEDMLEHIQRRKLELGIMLGPEEVDRAGNEDGRGGGKNVFSLTSTPYVEEEKKAEVEIVLNQHSKVQEDDKSRGGDSLQLPTDSDANAMQLLEMQLGLGNSRSNSTTTLLKKPPRKVGPRPWYTSGGKSRLLVSSQSLSNLGVTRFNPSPTIPYSMGNIGAAMSAIAGGRRAPSRVRPFLHDGHDSESSIDGRQRMRAHSAGTNRWETRFGVISGASGVGSKGGGEESLWGSGGAPGDGSFEELEMAAAHKARKYDDSHPDVLVKGLTQKPVEERKMNAPVAKLEIPVVVPKVHEGAKNWEEGPESPKSALLASDSLLRTDQREVGGQDQRGEDLPKAMPLRQFFFEDASASSARSGRPNKSEIVSTPKTSESKRKGRRESQEPQTRLGARLERRTRQSTLRSALLKSDVTGW